jgi:hypothetical protein
MMFFTELCAKKVWKMKEAAAIRYSPLGSEAM